MHLALACQSSCCLVPCLAAGHLLDCSACTQQATCLALCCALSAVPVAWAGRASSRVHLDVHSCCWLLTAVRVLLHSSELTVCCFQGST